MSAAVAQVSWVDWVFLAVVGLSVIVGLVRGLLYEVMSLLGWVVAYVAAQAFGFAVAPSIPVGAPGSGLNLAASFVIVFVAVLIGWGFLSWLIKKLVQASPLSPLDRVLGAVFGLLRGVLVALVAATAVTMTPLATSPAWQAAHSVAGLQAVLAGLKPLLPHEVARHLRA
ncbi:CvpA family protein [Methylibium petroleiphilum]|uniref:CvpA family protein n=1 Tax=Methylibium petroleiphilum TaxID=105560 RepID=UPI00003CC7E5|nr:CvpA family protein [Methylibium petroleiphilum]